MGWLQLLVIVVLGLVPTPPAMPEGVAWAAHTLQYLLLMLWFGGIYPARRHLLIATGLVILGTGIEVAQAASIFRTFDLKDIAANVAGVIAGLLLVQTLLRNWCSRVESQLPGSGA